MNLGHDTCAYLVRDLDTNNEPLISQHFELGKYPCARNSNCLTQGKGGGQCRVEMQGADISR